jgi:hypothetical protein
MPRLAHTHGPGRTRARRGASGRTRSPRAGLQARIAPERRREPRRARSSRRRRRSTRDGGLVLVITFTTGALVMVALITLAATADSWWLLVSVIAADLAITGAVLATIARLLDDGSD